MRKPTTAFIFWDYRMQIKIRVLKYNELPEALKLIESTFMLFLLRRTIWIREFNLFWGL